MCMLKKLVKYGNSNALVLDKALLEVLNIAEGSIVKIKTDGVSLIITPQAIEIQEGISKTITPQESLQDASLQSVAAQCRNPENASAYMKELKEVFNRYSPVIKKIEAQEFPAFKELEARYKGDRSNPEYSKELLQLRAQHMPELLQMDQEVQDISKKYALPEHLYVHKKKETKLASSIHDFKKVHEKYRHVLHAVTQLNENHNYINESVLLAEKYQVTKNSPEYLADYAQLISKYIPEYAHYQNELKKVSETIK